MGTNRILQKGDVPVKFAKPGAGHALFYAAGCSLDDAPSPLIMERNEPIAILTAIVNKL
jgi:hypothetical protein